MVYLYLDSSVGCSGHKLGRSYEKVFDFSFLSSSIGSLQLVVGGYMNTFYVFDQAAMNIVAAPQVQEFVSDLRDLLKPARRGEYGS